MKRIIIPISIFLFLTSSVYACEPCLETLNLDETVGRADLIIVGQKIKDGPPSGPEGDVIDYGPDWIEVKILEILKGETSEEIIKVNSWSAMCSYGIVIDDRDYVMFLEYRSVKESSPLLDEDYTYNAVNYGCAEKTILIDDDSDIDELVAKLDLRLRAKADKIPSKETLFIYSLIIAIVLFITVFLILKLKKLNRT